MRGEASRIADRVSRDSLAPKLRDSGEDAPTRRAQSKTRLR